MTEVAHQAENHFFQAMLRQTLEESADQAFFHRVLGLGCEQLDQRNIQRAADVTQEHDGNIAFAGLEVGEVALGHGRFAGHQLARHAATVADLADPLAECSQKLAVTAFVGVAGFLVGAFGIGDVGPGIHVCRPCAENCTAWLNNSAA
ncbi:hypothetical protein SDC9_186124 [bioreactor metagenome]|uniref:Uncharacterized protein n=1 Tax=bioreactor metagenome TaxID=1076179 RepID=A0A645HIN1_9ZZZZ